MSRQFIALFVLSYLAGASESYDYSVIVLDRSLTSHPLLQYNTTSFARNTLNAAWLPLPGENNQGGGLFFRTIAAPGTKDFDNIGFVKALTADGLHYPRVELSNLLHDGPDPSVPTTGADPRATYWPEKEQYFVTYQTSNAEIPGRHTFISQTKTPLDVTSWKRFSKPMFEGFVNADGSPFLQTTQLTSCNATDPSQRWSFSYDGKASNVVHESTGMCLSILPGASDSDLLVGLQACSLATKWFYDNKTQQVRAEEGVCLDADHGIGPKVGFYRCHAPGSKDYGNQRWDVMSGHQGTIRSESANGSQCITIRHVMPNDCGTVLWFPKGTSNEGLTTRAYAIATFGELRGGNMSLVSSTDLMQWKFEGVILQTRADHWDNATLSTGPAPVLLDDGNYLLLYNVDNLWPVANPQPLPAYGRCALGWAILDGKDFTRVIARAEEPLVFAQLPWEVKGFTPFVVYTDGVRPEGGNVFTVYAGAGDSAVEAFRIRVDVKHSGNYSAVFV